jgi:hypothetical protein
MDVHYGITSGGIARGDFKEDFLIYNIRLDEKGQSCQPLGRLNKLKMQIKKKSC